MLPVDQSLCSFREHIEQKRAIVCSSTSWKTEGCFKRLFRILFRRENARLESIGKCFCGALDQLERQPVLFNLPKNKAKSQSENYRDYQMTAKTVVDLLKSNKSKGVQIQLHQVAKRVAALNYRIEAKNGGLDPLNTIDGSLVDRIKGLAKSWKGRQKLFTSDTLSEKDIKKIEEVASYDSFANLLFTDSQLREELFKWILRDDNSVAPFVEYPATCKRLKETFLSSRIGHFKFDLIEARNIQHNNTPLSNSAQRVDAMVKEKFISLPFFDGKAVNRVSILDENRRVTLNGGWNLAIKEIFNVFSQKNRVPGDIEYVGSLGIMNWNIYEQGSWNPETRALDLVDFNNPFWLDQMPMSKVCSKDELEAQYGIDVLLNEWVVCARASRESPDLALEGRHGFLEIARPLEDGNYSIYPFGKYASQFPETALQLLGFLGNTIPAKLCYPDENLYYSHRQHALHPIKLKQGEGEKIIESIRQDLAKAREGNLVFQVRHENCSFWVQKKLQENDVCSSRNIYQIPLKELQSKSKPLDLLLRFLRAVPNWCHLRVVQLFDKLLFGHRGIHVEENGKKVFKSVNAIPLHKKGQVSNPGALHKLIDEGKLHGQVYAGNR